MKVFLFYSNKFLISREEAITYRVNYGGLAGVISTDNCCKALLKPNVECSGTVSKHSEIASL